MQKIQITKSQAIKEVKKPLNELDHGIHVRVNENYYEILNFTHDDTQIYFARPNDAKTYSIPVETTTRFYK